MFRPIGDEYATAILTKEYKDLEKLKPIYEYGNEHQQWRLGYIKVPGSLEEHLVNSKKRPLDTLYYDEKDTYKYGVAVPFKREPLSNFEYCKLQFEINRHINAINTFARDYNVFSKRIRGLVELGIFDQTTLSEFTTISDEVNQFIEKTEGSVIFLLENSNFQKMDSYKSLREKLTTMKENMELLLLSIKNCIAKCNEEE